MNNNNTDVLQLFVVMAASIFGPSMAGLIGPYLLIVVAAATGAAWSLSRRGSRGRFDSVFYFLRIIFTAVLLTVAISNIAVSFLDKLQAEWLYAPVALIIGLIGDEWYKLWQWVRGIIDKKIGN